MATEWDTLTEEQKSAVLKDQRYRCEETQHDWVNACSVLFQIYQRCRWCGKTR